MKSIILTVTIFISFVSSGIARKNQEDTIPTIGANMSLNTLIRATINNDIKLFKSVCVDNMKEAISAAQLTAVSKQLAIPMKQGYKKIFMGVLDRGSYKTYYWKIDFDKDGISDMLAELSLGNKKVSGFIIR
ncbi:MAG: hypothetical protein ACI9SQ_001672 [Rubritalea sp.]|jgi:hypothetical protein